MNERRIITMLVVAGVLVCAAGCPEPIVIQGETVYQEVEANDVAAEEPAAMPITFDDLNLNMKIDVPFRDEMLTEKVKELAGKRVWLNGVMHGGALNQKQIEQFILLRNKEHKYGPGRPADTLVEVKMRTGETVKFTSGDVHVEGTLRIEPKTGDDGNTWSLYILEEATVDKTP